MAGIWLPNDSIFFLITIDLSTSKSIDRGEILKVVAILPNEGFRKRKSKVVERDWKSEE